MTSHLSGRRTLSSIMSRVTCVYLLHMTTTVTIACVYKLVSVGSCKFIALIFFYKPWNWATALEYSNRSINLQQLNVAWHSSLQLRMFLRYLSFFVYAFERTCEQKIDELMTVAVATWLSYIVYLRAIYLRR